MAPFESASATGICATGRTRKLGTMPGTTLAKIRFLEPRPKPPFPLYTRSCGQLEIPARSAISRGCVSPQPSPELIKPNRFLVFPEPGLTLAYTYSHYVLIKKF